MTRIEKLDIAEIETGFAVINPTSSTHKQAIRRLRRLEKHVPFKIERVITSADRQQTRRDINTALRKFGNSKGRKGLAFGVYGDGGQNTYDDVVLNSDGLSDEARLTPILTIGGGNGQDGHKAKHPGNYRWDPELMIRDGFVVDIYPMGIRINPTKNEQQANDVQERVDLTLIAEFYATLGATALATKEIGRPKHRNSLIFGRTRPGRRISEPFIALGGLLAAGVNTVSQNGETRRFFEEQFINSGVMATYLNYHTVLTKKELFHTIVEERHLGQMIGHALRLRKGTMSGDYLEPGNYALLQPEDTQTDGYSFTTTHDTWLQYDGDAIKIPPRHDVTVSIYDQPIREVVTDPRLFVPYLLAA